MKSKTTKDKYTAILEESYEKAKAWRGFEDTGKLEFLSSAIFGFCTYEDTISSLMAQKAVEICAAISDKKTFDYISTDEGHLWYLLMVNMPFFYDKLDWGGSIRGAWWDLYAGQTFAIKSCDLFQDGEQVLELKLDSVEWEEFIAALNSFIKTEVQI